MRPTNILRTIATVALIAAPVALHAQGRRSTARAAAPVASDREGYSLSLGLGGGSSGVSCAGCATNRENGMSGYLRLGKGMSPSLMMGVELNGWNKTQQSVTSRNTMLSAIAQWYPSMTNGFFAKGGLGVGRTMIDDKSSVPSNKFQSTGLGYQVGVGYDMSVARRWSVTPFLNYLSTAGAKGQLNGTSTNQKFDGNYFQYGLGLSWH
jgi:hypothetical protein